MLELCTKEQLEKIYKEINLTPSSAKYNITHIQEWLQKQPHLPDIQGKQFLRHYYTRLAAPNGFEELHYYTILVAPNGFEELYYYIRLLVLNGSPRFKLFIANYKIDNQ